MARLSEGGKEQVKLRAGYVNGLATGFFTAGVLTPTLATVLNPNIMRETTVLAFLATVICFTLSIVLHLRAYEHLRELDQ